ncbi:hypothetical protein Nmel_003424, partial [Mimus melanotis]
MSSGAQAQGMWPWRDVAMEFRGLSPRGCGHGGMAMILREDPLRVACAARGSGQTLRCNEFPGLIPSPAGVSGEGALGL